MTRRNKTRDQHAGMTLIELLVVVGILGLLSVIVLPAISGNEENRFTRAAAEQVSSLISQVRNDAMGSGRPAGITIRPINAGSAAAIDVFRCRVPPPYRGATTSATVQFTASPIPILTGTGGGIADMKSAGVSIGDLITLDDRGPMYGIASVPEPGQTQFQITMRPTDAGQTTANTPWPPENVPMTFAVERQTRVVGSPVSLGQGRCVDLRWSGFGSASAFTSLNNDNSLPLADVSIVFDAKGQIQQVIRNGSRLTVNGPIFLLIGRTDRAGSNYSSDGGPGASDDSIGANWQYPSSYWIAIDPVSGQVRTAECQPNVGNNVVASRLWASQALVSQGL